MKKGVAKMSKKYGIGFLIGMIVLTLALVCAYQYTYNRAARKREMERLTQEQEPVLHTEGNATKENGYFITQADGYVIVYYADRKTVYEYTSILVEFLPENVQKKVKDGMEMSNVNDVYGFLENYSS